MFDLVLDRARIDRRDAQPYRAAGRLRDLDPRLLAQSFGGMLLAFGVIGPLVRGDPAGDPALTARAVTDLFLPGALPRGRSRR